MPSPLTHKEFQFDQDRFVELMAFIARGSIADPTFGAVKLNKILYYADFSAYRMFGQPLTGATYFKLQEGPAPREMLQARARCLRPAERTSRSDPTSPACRTASSSMQTTWVAARAFVKLNARWSR